LTPSELRRLISPGDSEELSELIRDHPNLIPRFIHFQSLNRTLQHIEQLCENTEEELRQVFDKMEEYGLHSALAFFIARKRREHREHLSPYHRPSPLLSSTSCSDGLIDSPPHSPRIRHISLPTWRPLSSHGTLSPSNVSESSSLSQEVPILSRMTSPTSFASPTGVCISPASFGHLNDSNSYRTRVASLVEDFRGQTRKQRFHPYSHTPSSPLTPSSDDSHEPPSEIKIQPVVPVVPVLNTASSLSSYDTLIDDEWGFKKNPINVFENNECEGCWENGHSIGNCMKKYRKVGDHYVRIKDRKVSMEKNYVLDMEHLDAKEQSLEL
jgi:hypothetical protein